MITDHFKLAEMTCPHVYVKFGNIAWSFFDIRLLITLESIRLKINKPIFVNNWQTHGEFDERGFRCIECSLVQKAIAEKRLYVSPHMTGQGVDFDIPGLVAEEVREYIIKNKNLWPYSIRLEKDVNWVHLDVRGGDQKVILFNP
jgi:hypothetical protein